MGHNIDLCWLLGLPDKVNCKRCKTEIDTMFDDYDIDCGEPNVMNNGGFLTLDVYCNECDHEFKMKFEVNSKNENKTELNSYEGILSANSATDRGTAGILYAFDFLTMNRQFMDYFKEEKQKVRIKIEVIE